LLTVVGCWFFQCEMGRGANTTAVGAVEVVVAEDEAVAVSGMVVAPVREEVIENAAATTTTAMSAALATATVSWEVAGRTLTSPRVLRMAKAGHTRVVAAEADAVDAEDTVKATSVLVGASLTVTAGTLEGELSELVGCVIRGRGECVLGGDMSLILMTHGFP
jgi:hypothetical protein